jgi:hypothetical protein
MFIVSAFAGGSFLIGGHASCNSLLGALMLYLEPENQQIFHHNFSFITSHPEETLQILAVVVH